MQVFLIKKSRFFSRLFIAPYLYIPYNKFLTMYACTTHYMTLHISQIIIIAIGKHHKMPIMPNIPLNFFKKPVML